jgi:hypothetical protein
VRTTSRRPQTPPERHRSVGRAVSEDPRKNRTDVTDSSMLDRDVSVAVNERSTVATSRACGMAPSPENDSAPKAPDKPRHDKCAAPKEKNKDDKTLSDLNDGELKGLLDEALNYKNPKDREGKSKLFNHLLNEAEEDERNARAARAGGSELVRYCNPSAKRNSRHRKKPSSISENMMHGGSLDNLAKEELFETSKHRTKKSVSARQREGGKHYHKFSRVKTLIPSDRREPAVQRQRKHRHEPRVPVPGGGQEKEGDEREEERRRRRGAEIARTRLPRPELPRKIQRDPTVSV